MNESSTQPQTGRLESVLPVVADKERRAILTHLREPASHTASLDELTSVLATETGLERERAMVRLHHAHLPKLADVEIVDYDVDTKTVQYLGNPTVETLLDTLQS